MIKPKTEPDRSCVAGCDVNVLLAQRGLECLGRLKVPGLRQRSLSKHSFTPGFSPLSSSPLSSS